MDTYWITQDVVRFIKVDNIIVEEFFKTYFDVSCVWSF